MARKATGHSGVTYPGWVAQYIAASAHGLVATAGPYMVGRQTAAQLLAQVNTKPAVHWQAGNGATLCGISTQSAPQGHKTYGNNFVLVLAMPAPRKGKPFAACGQCRSAGAVGAMAVLGGGSNG